MTQSRNSVLLVDQDNTWLEFASLALKRAGFKVFSVHDLSTARNLLERRAFDLILADSKQLEVKQQGLEFLINSLGHHTERLILMFATDLSPVLISRMLRAGVYDCVDKEFHEGGIVEMVTSELNAATVSPEDLIEPIHVAELIQM